MSCINAGSLPRLFPNFKAFSEGLISDKFLNLFSDFEIIFCARRITSPSSIVISLSSIESKIIELKLSPGLIKGNSSKALIDKWFIII